MDGNDEARLLEALREYANGEEPREDDGIVVDAALARMADESAKDQRPGRRGSLVFAAGTIAGAAAAALIVAVLPDDAPVPTDAVASIGEVQSPIDRGHEYRIPAVPTPAAAASETLWIEARGARACVDMPAGTTLCVEPGSRIPVGREAFGDGIVVLSVVIGSVDVTTTQGVVHRVDSGQRLDVSSGAVSAIEPRDLDGPREVTKAPRSPTPTPDDLLNDAKSERLRDTARATRLYRQLIERHPGSSAARAALVSLGQLELEDNRNPKRAVQLFDRYLAGGGGVLEEEALYYRVRAFRTLGQAAQEHAAAAEYLQRYPSGTYAHRLKDRLRALGER